MGLASCDISFRDTAPPDVEALLYDVLYRDFGVAEGAAWRETGEGSVVAIARDGRGKVVGSARLLSSPGDVERQLRQLAVSPDARGSGVGRMLIDGLERRAAGEGATAIVLNARDSAWEFYEHLGYTYTGPEFVSELTGIVHRPMRRELGPKRERGEAQ